MMSYISIIIALLFGLCFSLGCLYQKKNEVTPEVEASSWARFGLFHVQVSLSLFFRLDDLRHRLIPLYSYDPAEEQEDWGDAGREDEDAELNVGSFF